MEAATSHPWQFDFGEAIQLASDERRHSGDFIGEASLRVVEGSYDLVVILTDWAIDSRREAISILVATCYLCFAQNLFLPRKKSRFVPEHLAVANVVIFVSMLLAILGLFVMVALLTLTIELWAFPSDPIATWPTLGE